MCPDSNQIQLNNTLGEQIVANGTMCMKWLDTEQEKKINLGVSWPYEKLAPYECLVASELGQQGVKVGDQIIITVSWTGFWNLLRHQYNVAARENDWNSFPEYSWQDSTTYN